MSIAAAQADTFFNEVTAAGEVWAIRDEGGFPTSTNASGETAMPFWSKESRARKVIGNVKNYATFEVERLPLEKFAKTWLPGLQRDGLLVGINWSGEMASGYDMTPEEVADRLSIMKR